MAHLGNGELIPPNRSVAYKSTLSNSFLGFCFSERSKYKEPLPSLQWANELISEKNFFRAERHR